MEEKEEQEPPRKRRQLSKFQVPKKSGKTEIGTAEACPILAPQASQDFEALDHETDSAWKETGKSQRTLSRLQSATEETAQQLPSLSSSQDLLSDQTVHYTLRLSTSCMSWKWLRRLPTALLCQRDKKDLSDPVRAAALEACRANLPCLLADESKALAWLSAIAASLSWYELEGPTRTSGQDEVQDVQEWDKAYGSLWLLLQQGALPSFSIEAERFSVLVFGEGAETWTSPADGQQTKPTRAEPFAILWPSSRELRSMLQENRVYFDVAPPALHQQASTAELPKSSAGDSGCAGGSSAVVPLVEGGTSAENGVPQATRQDLLELRRDGERAKTPGDGEHDFKNKTALRFQGSWRVHLLLNALRQHFLGHPMASAVKMPQKLPKLLAPASFANSAVKSAQVDRAAHHPAGNETGGGEFFAELRGRWFPSQTRKFLELLRVIVPKFSCTFTSPLRHGPGSNAFTQLGQRRIAAVRSEKDSSGTWKWLFDVV